MRLSRPLIIGGGLVGLAMIAHGLAWQARPWKEHQRQYLDARLALLEQRLAQTRSELAEDITFHENGIQVALDRQSEHADDISRLQRELRTFDRQLRRAEEQRSLLESQRSQSNPQRNAELESELRERRIEAESFRELADDRRSQLNRLTADLQQAQQLLEQVQQPIVDAERQLREVEAAPWWRWPVLRWFDPRLQIREVVPQQITPASSLGTGPVAPVVDRCVTCHVGMVRGEAGSGPILGAHPRPELYLTQNLHALDEIGCTSCHGGEGRATDFVAAGHLPKDANQAEAWQQDFAWRQTSIAQPILTGGLLESSCAACHGPGLVTAEAGLERAGRALQQGLGCGSCHGGSGAQRSSLARIATKTSRQWLHDFLEDPLAHSASSWMPRMWPADSDQATRRVEIQAAVDYLWQRSKQQTLSAPAGGDPERGGQLFEELGCRACHLMDAATSRTAHLDQPTRLRGPNLAPLAAKTNSAWLYGWLLDPTSYRPDTLMPDFRLSAAEAADLTAFLLTPLAESPARDLPAWSPIDPAIVDRLVTKQLERDLTIEQAAASLEAMTPAARVQYLGQRVLIERSCHQCHELPGIEYPAAVERAPGFEQVANQLLQRVARDEDLVDWLHTSTAAERAGEYTLEPREARALSAHLLSYVPRPTTADLPAWQALGEQVLERHACRACHSLGDVGGLGDRPAQQRPPELDGIGAKLNPAWLFEYLEDSSEVLRPWLTSRMPDHALTTEERNSLVTYFAKRAEGDLWVDSPDSSDATSLAVGGAVFNMLQCNRCHVDYEDRGGIAVSHLAPQYDSAGRRLRPDWAERWILDPRAIDPQTAMPQSFPRGADGELEASFLIGTLGAPMFQVQRIRLERFFTSEAEMHTYLSNPELVAKALRDYLWSLESP